MVDITCPRAGVEISRFLGLSERALPKANRRLGFKNKAREKAIRRQIDSFLKKYIDPRDHDGSAFIRIL